MTIKFTKMHGCGNDYVYVNCFEQHVAEPERLSQFVSDRHFGIGSDGLVLIMPSETCDFRMRMFNADGSEAQMCGNASRCVAKYCYDHKLTRKKEFTLETLAGVKVLTVYTYADLGQISGGLEAGDKVAKVTVNMGEPILRPADIPVVCDDADRCVAMNLGLPQVEGVSAECTAVSMGNPHAVYFVDTLDRVNGLELEKFGPQYENHKAFPARVNSEFVHIINNTHARMRVWERGSGETWACGTGSCATLVACVLNGKTDRHIQLDLNGGTLDLNWDEATNCVFMTGPATEVFSGTMEWQ
ncbi:MAG: diaminopimelate epimerase [Bacteroidales bacterium]|nr:diaminopimelate epimerase [Candidatus Liminaster caballi]